MNVYAGKYIVFDGMAFPQQPSFLEGLGQRVKKFGTYLRLYNESDLKKPIPSHEQAQKESLDCFLLPHATTLTYMDFTTANLSEFVEDIFCVYEQLRVQKTRCDKRYSDPRGAYKLAEVRTYPLVHCCRLIVSIILGYSVCLHGIMRSC